MYKRLFVSSLALMVLLSFTGCQFFNKSKPSTDANEAANVDESENVNNEEQSLFNNGPKPVIDNYRPISVTLPDGLKLSGTLYIPGISPYKMPAVDESNDEAAKVNEEATAEDKPSPVKPAAVQYPLIILYHMLSGDRWDWKDYPRHLVNAGYAVLAVDLRGHGDSVYQGSRLRVWRQFDRNDWQKMPDDTGYLLDYIAKQQEFNMVNTGKIGLVGASIGANIAVNYASKHPGQVKAIVLLSPGLEYHGLETFNAMTHYENPVYMIASKEDAYASDSTERLYKFALGKKKIQIFQDLGHGTDMLDNNANLGKNIIDWLKEVVAPPQVAGGAEEEISGAPSPSDTQTNQAAGDGTKPIAKDAAQKADQTKTPADKTASKPADKTADKEKSTKTPDKTTASDTEKTTKAKPKLTPVPTKAATKPAPTKAPVKAETTPAPAQQKAPTPPAVKTEPVVKPATVTPPLAKPPTPASPKAVAPAVKPIAKVPAAPIATKSPSAAAPNPPQPAPPLPVNSGPVTPQ